MTSTSRDNYYNLRLAPRSADGPDLYWPTDQEFDLIESIILGASYAAFYRTTYGDRAQILWKAFSLDDRYEWLLLNFKSYTQDHALEVTQELVWKALMDFEASVVNVALAEPVVL